MPYCPLTVTCDLSKKQITDLSNQIQDALVEIAKKPPTAIMINIIPNCHMFLNKEGDTAFFEVNAVGMHDNDVIEKLGIRFQEIISSVTGITYNRIFVRFDISEPVHWILRGRALHYWRQKWAADGENGFSE